MVTHSYNSWSWLRWHNMKFTLVILCRCLEVYTACIERNYVSQSKLKLSFEVERKITNVLTTTYKMHTT